MYIHKRLQRALLAIEQNYEHLDRSHVLKTSQGGKALFKNLEQVKRESTENSKHQL